MIDAGKNLPPPELLKREIEDFDVGLGFLHALHFDHMLEQPIEIDHARQIHARILGDDLRRGLTLPTSRHRRTISCHCRLMDRPGRC